MTHSGIEVRVFVHGFLGLPSDWKAFARPGIDVVIDLWSIASADGFAGSVDAFQFAAERILSAMPQGQKPLLIGYSLGARLAMHTLLSRPESFKAVVLVSAHPGLPSEGDRQQRVLNDIEWAKRFRSEAWSNLMEAWNEQPVFRSSGTNKVTRDERNFERGTLAKALEYWSLGRQRDLRHELTTVRLPILLLTGVADKKFTALNVEWMINLAPANIQHQVIADSGHRVPWDQPQNFIEAVQGFC
jgi:2-succinyl-6-hydroxy-2,4-cyclohexadiene-1-carboxylate synthase